MRVLTADNFKVVTQRLVVALTAVSGIEIVGQAGTVTEASQVVSYSGKRQPIQYICSRCLQFFLLPEDQQPKEAAAELYHALCEHLEQEHPNLFLRPIVLSVGDRQTRERLEPERKEYENGTESGCL